MTCLRICLRGVPRQGVGTGLRKMRASFLHTAWPPLSVVPLGRLAAFQITLSRLIWYAVDAVKAIAMFLLRAGVVYLLACVGSWLAIATFQSRFMNSVTFVEPDLEKQRRIRNSAERIAALQTAGWITLVWFLFSYS